MKTGSNTQATAESLKRTIEESSVKEGDVKKSKTEEASKEAVPTEAVIRSKILEFLAKGLDSEKIVNALGQVKGLSSFSPANLLKIVQPVVDSMAKSPELSGSIKASAEKLLNFIEKKIENEEKENHGANKDLRVPTVGNQNPKSAQASPRQESAQASPRQESAQASQRQESAQATKTQTHVEKVTTTTNSGTGRSL